MGEARSVVVAIAVSTALALACGSPPDPRRPAVVLERRGCLADPPPDPPPMIVWEACGDPWAACLSKPSAALVFTWLTKLTRYARDAYDRCGPDPKEAP